MLIIKGIDSGAGRIKRKRGKLRVIYPMFRRRSAKMSRQGGIILFLASRNKKEFFPAITFF